MTITVTKREDCIKVEVTLKSNYCYYYEKICYYYALLTEKINLLVL